MPWPPWLLPDVLPALPRDCPHYQPRHGRAQRRTQEGVCKQKFTITKKLLEIFTKRK